MLARVLVEVLLPVAGAKPGTWPVAGRQRAGFRAGGVAEVVVAGRQVSRVAGVFRLRRSALSGRITGAAQLMALGQRWHVTAVSPSDGPRAGFLDVHAVSTGGV